jgi:hypothetical protein
MAVTIWGPEKSPSPLSPGELIYRKTAGHRSHLHSICPRQEMKPTQSSVFIPALRNGRS